MSKSRHPHSTLGGCEHVSKTSTMNFYGVINTIEQANVLFEIADCTPMMSASMKNANMYFEIVERAPMTSTTMKKQKFFIKVPMVPSAYLDSST
jgi:hypothetical protein